MVNGWDVILADFVVFKVNLLAKSFNNFVQPICFTGYRKKIISLTGAVVPFTEIRIARNVKIDEADQHALSYIEEAEVVLSFGYILFSQNCVIFKLEEKKHRL